MGLLLHVMSFICDGFVKEVKYRIVTQRKRRKLRVSYVNQNKLIFFLHDIEGVSLVDDAVWFCLAIFCS